MNSPEFRSEPNIDGHTADESSALEHPPKKSYDDILSSRIADIERLLASFLDAVPQDRLGEVSLYKSVQVLEARLARLREVQAEVRSSPEDLSKPLVFIRGMLSVVLAHVDTQSYREVNTNNPNDLAIANAVATDLMQAIEDIARTTQAS